MTDQPKLCAATTKSGAPCKNKAQPNSDYCYVHRKQTVSASDKPTKSKSTAKAPPSSARVAAKSTIKTAPKPDKHAPLAELARELDKVVDEIHAQLPNYTPPPFSPQALITMIKQNSHRFTPELQRDIVNQLKASIDEADPHSLVEPETWKSLWYMLNYSFQAHTSTLREQLADRLSALPGVAQLSDWTSNLEAPSPKELLDADTWKSAWHVLNHSLKEQADELKRKWTGDTAEK